MQSLTDWPLTAGANVEKKKGIFVESEKQKVIFSQRQCLQCPRVPDPNQPTGLLFCRLCTEPTHLLLKEIWQTPAS